MKKGKNKNSKFIHSVKFKIIVMIFIIVFVCNTMNFLLATGSMEKSMRAMIEDNLLSVAVAYGAIVDEHISECGTEVLDLSGLSDVLADVEIAGMESAYIYVVNARGKMLYHPDHQKIGLPAENDAVNSLVGQLKTGVVPEPDFMEYVYKGEVKYAGYYITENQEAILIVTVDESDALASLNALKLKMQFSCVIAMFSSAAIGLVLAGIFLKPVDDITRYLSELSTLKFHKDAKLMKLSRKKDEFGSIANAVVKVVDTLAETMDELQNQSAILQEASEVLNAKTKDTTHNINQVENAMNEIAGGVSSQAKNTEEAAENIHMIVEQIESTNTQVDRLSQNAQNMSTAGKNAIWTLQELIMANDETVKAMEEIFEQVKVTNQSVVNIREATNLITSIAQQTNLLSLNASIEAARAGEAGRGFSVVASEIQNLAGQTSESANRIEEIVNTLIKESAREMKTMEEVMEIMKKQDEHVSETNRVFGGVIQGIDSSMKGIQNIAERTSEMDSASGKVIDVVGSLSAIAEENAASTEETSASLTCVVGFVDEIAAQCDTLKEIAEQLEEKINMFDLK